MAGCPIHSLYRPRQARWFSAGHLRQPAGVSGAQAGTESRGDNEPAKSLRAGVGFGLRQQDVEGRGECHREKQYPGNDETSEWPIVPQQGQGAPGIQGSTSFADEISSAILLNRLASRWAKKLCGCSLQAA